MKASIIAPIKFLNKYCITNFHVCYADLILSNEQYRNFYISRVRAGHTVILDHSNLIPRVSYGYQEFMGAFKLLKPDYIVLPSKEFNSSKTIGLTILRKSDYKPAQTIGIATGVDIRSLRECFSSVRLHVDVVGFLPSVQMIKEFPSLLEENRDTKFIFLGTYRNPLREIPSYPNVIGCCSDWPLRLGIDLRKLSEAYPQPPELDFNIDEELMPEITEENVELFLERCEEV